MTNEQILIGCCILNFAMGFKMLYDLYKVDLLLRRLKLLEEEYRHNIDRLKLGLPPEVKNPKSGLKLPGANK